MRLNADQQYTVLTRLLVDPILQNQKLKSCGTNIRKCSHIITPDVHRVEVTVVRGVVYTSQQSGTNSLRQLGKYDTRVSCAGGRGQGVVLFYCACLGQQEGSAGGVSLSVMAPPRLSHAIRPSLSVFRFFIIAWLKWWQWIGGKGVASSRASGRNFLYVPTIVCRGEIPRWRSEAV